MSEVIFNQVVGLVASALIIASFAQKSDKHFKIVIMLGAFAFGLHYVLLGAYSGAAVAVINGLQTGLSMKFYNSHSLLGVFVVFYIFAGFYLYETWVDLLPVLAGAVSTIAMFKLSGIKLRFAFLMAEFSWFAYSIIVKSIGGLITNIFSITTNSITIHRLFKDKKVAMV